MLVLGRKVGEAVHIGDQIKVKIVGISGNRVKIGIEAPEHIRIAREDLFDWEQFSFGESPLIDGTIDQCCELAVV